MLEIQTLRSKNFGLRGIVRMLPVRFPAAVFVVQHIGRNRSILPTLLSQAGPLPASSSADGQGIVPGHIYVAPPDHHMRLTLGLIPLDAGPKIHFTRPAADPLFQSAARAYGARVVGVVLSGGDGEGPAGLRDIKARGGISIVQDPDQAENPGMPRQAIRGGDPDYCLPRASFLPPITMRASGSSTSRIRSSRARPGSSWRPIPRACSTRVPTGRRSSSPPTASSMRRA
jgi:two-component system chemotaxis response regulator CheB